MYTYICLPVKIKCTAAMSIDCNYTGFTLSTEISAYHDGPDSGDTKVPLASHTVAAFVKSPLTPPLWYASLR